MCWRWLKCMIALWSGTLNYKWDLNRECVKCVKNVLKIGFSSDNCIKERTTKTHLNIWGYTEHQPGGWSGRACWRAAWRWREETRWASSAEMPPDARNRSLDKQTLYSVQKQQTQGEIMRTDEDRLKHIVSHSIEWQHYNVSTSFQISQKYFSFFIFIANI